MIINLDLISMVLDSILLNSINVLGCVDTIHPISDMISSFFIEVWLLFEALSVRVVVRVIGSEWVANLWSNTIVPVASVVIEAFVILMLATVEWFGFNLFGVVDELELVMSVLSCNIPCLSEVFIEGSDVNGVFSNCLEGWSKWLLISITVPDHWSFTIPFPAFFRIAVLFKHTWAAQLGVALCLLFQVPSTVIFHSGPISLEVQDSSLLQSTNTNPRAALFSLWVQVKRFSRNFSSALFLTILSIPCPSLSYNALVIPRIVPVC